MSGKKVLVVDDEEDVRIFLKDFLDEQDLEVCTASNGIQALEVMEAFPADLVLLDIMMPEMDGIECLKHLRKKHPKTHVIMITAIKDDARIETCHKLGALNYIIKPFSLKYLESELTKLFP